MQKAESRVSACHCPSICLHEKDNARRQRERPKDQDSTRADFIRDRAKQPISPGRPPQPRKGWFGSHVNSESTGKYVGKNVSN